MANPFGRMQDRVTTVLFAPVAAVTLFVDIVLHADKVLVDGQPQPRLDVLQQVRVTLVGGTDDQLV